MGPKIIYQVSKLIYVGSYYAFVKSAIIQPKQVMTTQPVVANRQSVRLKKTRNNAETE